MNKYQELSSEITSYLKGKLSEEEIVAFENKMENDSGLKEEVRFRKLMMKGLGLIGEKELIDQIDAVKKELEQKASRPAPKIRRLSRKYLTIAASAVIFLIIGTYWMLNKNYTDSALFGDAYQFPGFTGADNFRGDEELENKLYVIKNAYNNNEYDKAIESLSSVPDSSSYYPIAQYNLGNLYLENDQPGKAIEAFKQVENSGDIRFKEDVDWYLVLAYIQNGEVNGARTGLKNILQNDKHSYFLNAQQLERKLNSFWKKLI